MADQEPKRAFTASGSYPMGLFQSGDSVDITADITGTSDFTFMIWAYPTTANQYIFKTSDNTAFLQIKSDGKLRFQILNANSTNSVVESASAISLNTLQMITVTGNTTNGLNLYINDTLNNSGSMPANNNVAGKTWQLGTNFDGSLALFRSWSKELALADVEAHYAYDEGLLLQGGVAVSAMTTDQKTSLEFAVEMIEDIPYDSDEFDDRSTNKYAVTNNGVTLTGQSLQVYTSASDLPSLEPNAFAPNVATLDGSTQYFDAGNPTEFDIFTANNPYTIEAWYSPKTTTGVGVFIGQSRFTDRTFTLVRNGDDLQVDRSNSSGLDTITIANSLTVGNWYHVVYTYDGSTMSVYLNDATPQTLASSRVAPNATTEVYIGAQGSNPTGATTHDNCQINSVRFYNRALNATEVTALYNDGSVPCYGDIDTSITDDCVYAPNLMIFNGRTEASALVDNSASGITTTAVGSPTYEPTGALIVSDGGIQYNTNFADLNGSTQSFNGGDIMDIGTSDFSMCGWFKSTSNINQSLMTKSNGTPAYQPLLVGNGNIRQDVSYDGSNRWTVDGVGNFNDGEWHSYIMHVERSTPTFTFIVDGVTLSQSVIQSSGVITQDFNSTSNFIIGDVGYGGINFDGGMLLQGIAIGGDLTPYANEFYNGGTPKSYTDMSQGFKDQFATGDIWRLGNFNDNSGNELTGLANGNVLANTGSTPFESELAVECNEAPVPPAPALGEFIFSVKTDNQGDSNDDQFQMGTRDQGVYNCTVDWGDGNSDTITTWNDPRWTHTYSVAGTYTITISGTSFTYPYFGDVFNDSDKVMDISQWGLTNYGISASRSFISCANLTISASDVPDTSSVTNLNDSWRNCLSLTSFPLIDTSSVNSMSSAWRNCPNLTSFPLIDTSSVTSMTSVWYDCSSLTSFPLINTSLVTNINIAWYGCSSLTSFPLIDTSSATLMGGTWDGCSSLTSFPLINTSLVTYMLETWLDCSSLADFPLIDVSSCTDFTDTWKGCALNSASIDNIMQALVNGNQSTLSTDISGGTNLGFASWSAGAVANYNTLVSRGWTITYNP
jgi:hypothetical protein